MQDGKCLSVTLNACELSVQPIGWPHQVPVVDSPNTLGGYFWRH